MRVHTHISINKNEKMFKNKKIIIVTIALLIIMKVVIATECFE